MTESRNRLREVFKAAGRRLTSQRCLILDVLRVSDEHLDAEGVYERARNRAPDISLATVYRTLALLKEMGLVEEHRLGHGHSHYEAVQERQHFHFTCQRCGKVVEFDAPSVAKIARELSEREGVEVTKAHLHLAGQCRECREEDII
ncbi:MAG: Fur family transcriptional regulator [Anaerolineae bacterium]|jgi:Fe2+ or Zn2+ uptake regulation protein